MLDNGFRLQAGPQAGFLLSADNKDDLNPIDFGVSIGAAMLFRQRVLVLMPDIILD